MLKHVSALLLCYIIGSIPWSTIVAKLFMRAPIDLAEEGTKNVGAANVWHLAGPVAGCIAASGDALKGALAVLAAKVAGLPRFFWPLCGWMAVVGHAWSIFLNFRGGRGASATAGVFVVMMPWEAMATGLLIATALLTFGGCLLSSLALMWPFTILISLARETIDFKTACTVTFLVVWVLALGWSRLRNDFNDFTKALGQHLVRRKLYRYSALAFPALVYPVFGYSVLRKVLLVSAGIAIVIEFLRHRSAKFNEGVKKLFAPVGRAEEAEHISSTTMFLCGCALASFFPDPLGVFAVVMLILGDAWAVLCGLKFGRTPLIRGKTLEGSLGCFVVCLLSCLMLSKLLAFPLSFLAMIAASFVTALVEAVTPRRLDNLTMGPLAALTLFILS
ncbi:glycerol-3-phosphate acyltransferase [Acetomicrobium sp.]|uniref:glycerol-3-phosphate acyltransferase n=1 Tax=Acetomicrobium sp. TaxID=1872099 RepID=UPI002FC5C3C1